MCGIVGMLRWGGLQEDDPQRIERATGVLRHRGPDGNGFWQDGNCALGFQRLKVIDRTMSGDQPMANETGKILVVFNGEIYNFRELRDHLESRGHTFRSRTDTEVLLHGYEEWRSEELLARLRGMYAFAIWDTSERKLLLARDPLGVKPLYFAERDDCILFASEPKALFATGVVKPEVDGVALHEALTYRYVPAPRSGYRDVEKLPPGHLATASAGTLQYRRWWQLPGNDNGDSASEGIRSLSESLEERIHAAVQRRMIADVPIGAWLSSGIDSGLVVSQISDRGSHKTFCAGFANPEYDERKLAALSATKLETEHEDFLIPSDVFRSLPQIIWHVDEPYFDSSCLPTFILARETRRDVTVALSGDGGDEAFGGYERYAGMQMLNRWRRTPNWLRNAVLAVARWRKPAPSRQGWDRLVRWLDHCHQLESQGFHPYLGAMTLFSQEQIRGLYGERLTEELAEVDGREYLANTLLRHAKAKYPEMDGGSRPVDVSILQRTDLEAYLPGDVLLKVDRMSMAHGLEVRSPFLDIDLLGWALSLPDAARVRGRRTKTILRELAGAKLPSEVVHARKRGFGVPLDAWFRGPLMKIAADWFEKSFLVSDGLFRKGYWEALWKEHQDGKAQHGERLYALLSLECWYKTFIADEPAMQCPEPLG